MGLVLLTNVNQYAGPGALLALLADGHQVVCHDRDFADGAARTVFEAGQPSACAVAASTPDAIHNEVIGRWGIPDAIILNDVHPITPDSIEAIPPDDFRTTFEAVVMIPVRITQMFLPAMKTRRSGAFVFVTSARDAQPEPGFTVPTTLRAATTAFCKAVAKEAAPFGIQANVVAPNYLYSEMYYPRARFVDAPEGRAAISRAVPFVRSWRFMASTP